MLLDKVVLSDPTRRQVQECNGPRLLVYSRHPGGSPEIATRVHILFESNGDGCRMTLVHEGFEVLGERGPIVRDNYVPGWKFVFGECFKARAEA